MSTLIVQTRNVSFQKVLYKHKANLQWLFKWLGYSSLAASIISMIIYWYKKNHAQRPRIAMKSTSQQQQQQQQHQEEDVLHINPKRKLHISTTMKRSSSSLSNLSLFSERRSSLMTPPASPLSSSQSINSISSSGTSPVRSLSPRSWSSRLMDGVISATRKRKRMTISLKNTILWNPSRDVNTPNHAFHENTVLLLNKLAQVYDIYVMIHMNSEQERQQIHQLLNNANLLIDPRKILYCSTEQGKLHLIKHIQPSIHIEGGCELDDGRFIIEQLKNSFIEQTIWIKSNIEEEEELPIMNDSMQCADNILKTCIAKQVGFALD